MSGDLPETDIEAKPEAVRFTAHLRARLARLSRAASDLVLPPLCLGCGTRISDHHALCAPCWRRIDFIRSPLCDRLGIPMPYDIGTKMVSAAAIADPPQFDRARAVARYDGLMRELIHAFKFGDNHNARSLFGRWLTEAGAEILADADLLVPIPLARTRLLSRRFNQAQIIASEVAHRRKIKVAPFAVVRARSTKSQVSLSRTARHRNVAGAFIVPPSSVPAVTGKAIVLVDDVITTGATASAAAQALKKAGARRVDVLALALVSEPYI